MLTKRNSGRSQSAMRAIRYGAVVNSPATADRPVAIRYACNQIWSLYESLMRQEFFTSQSAMRAIRYGVMKFVETVSYSLESQSAMRAIRYGATALALDNEKLQVAIRYACNQIWRVVMCTHSAETNSGRNPLCVLLDMEIGDVLCVEIDS